MHNYDLNLYGRLCVNAPDHKSIRTNFPHEVNESVDSDQRYHGPMRVGLDGRRNRRNDILRKVLKRGK